METFTHQMQTLRDGILGGLFCIVGVLLPAMVPKSRDLTGKTAVVTGSNSGVGYGMAFSLAEMGATVYLACRNEKKALQAQADMLKACPSAKVKTLSLDTASFNSVRKFSRDWCYGPIDILAHNAGITLVPKDKDFTEDGYEYQYQVNFLSSFLLTHLLEKHLTKDARVVFTSSIGSYFGRLSDDFALMRTQEKIEEGFHTAPRNLGNSARYAQTKLMQAVFAMSLQAYFDRQHDSKRFACSFEPGLVRSNLLQNLADAPFDPAVWFLGKLQPIVGLSAHQGAATGVHLATSDSPEVMQNKGRYFDRMQARAHIVDMYSQEKFERLWTRWSADCEIKWSA